MPRQHKWARRRRRCSARAARAPARGRRPVTTRSARSACLAPCLVPLENLKLTWPQDFALAERLWSTMTLLPTPLRVGEGWDAPTGRPLILGGITVPTRTAWAAIPMPTACCTPSPTRCFGAAALATSGATSPTPTTPHKRRRLRPGRGGAPDARRAGRSSTSTHHRGAGAEDGAAHPGRASRRCGAGGRRRQREGEARPRRWAGGEGRSIETRGSVTCGARLSDAPRHLRCINARPGPARRHPGSAPGVHCRAERATGTMPSVLNPHAAPAHAKAPRTTSLARRLPLAWPARSRSCPRRRTGAARLAIFALSPASSR